MATIEKSKFEPTLAQFGFSLKTKALVSYLYNPESRFDEFTKAVMETGYNLKQSKVYAIMLLNYYSNGSSLNWGLKGIKGLQPWAYMNKAQSFLNVDLQTRQLMMVNWISNMKPITFKRWADVLDALDTKKAELEKELTMAEIKVSKPVAEVYTELTVKEIEQILGYKIRIVA